MVDLYVKLIIKHTKSFDDVPTELQAQVRDRLEKLGYDTNGELIPVNSENSDE